MKRSKLPKLHKLILGALLLVALERAIRSQTSGFRLAKTRTDFPYNPEWEVDEQTPIPEILNQRFYFLGSGAQSYAFLSEDGTTVLKFFKHYHAGLSSKALQRLPFFKDRWQNLLEKRKRRIYNLFSSAILARQKLREQSGVFHLNLNEKKAKYPRLIIYDKIGIRYIVDLNQTPFLLQKKADLLFPHLETHPKRTAEIIDSLFAAIQMRHALGIHNSDSILNKNFGVLNSKVIEIDVGSFHKRPFVKFPVHRKRDLLYETQGLHQWLKANRPEMIPYFEEKLLQAIRL